MAFAAALAAFVSSPVVAQTVGDYLAKADVAGRAGDFPKAISFLEAADHIQPNDPTTLRLLGSTYGYARRYAPAIQMLQRAHRLAPADMDIALALSRAYLWSGDIAAARASAAEINVIDPKNSELPALIHSIERSVRASGTETFVASLTQKVSAITVGGDKRRWTTTAAVLSARLADRTSIMAGVDREDRSNNIDTRLELRLDHRLRDGLNAYAGAAATLHPDYRERWSIRGGAEMRISSPISLTLDLRRAAYRSATTYSLEGGARLHLGDDRYSLHLTSINLWSENGHHFGWSLRGEAQPRGPVRLLAGVAGYPDTEGGDTRDVRSAFIAAAVPIREGLAARLTLDREKRQGNYKRDGISIGASLRF